MCDVCLIGISGVDALLCVLQNFGICHFLICNFREIKRFPGAVDKFYCVRMALSFLILTSNSTIVNKIVQKNIVKKNPRIDSCFT